MIRGIQGVFRKQSTSPEPFDAYTPAPLPPVPPLDLSGELLSSKERADLALGRLDGIARLLPDLHLFLYFYLRKEAVLSSQIEGTQSSLSDLLLFESSEVPGVPLDDVQEVSNYVAALQHGIDRLKGGFPLSLRLLKEIHSILLSRGRGTSKEPGEFRRSQNWIGGTRPGNALFVPPAPEALDECLHSFELFLHSVHPELPPVIKAALAHVQFETIHPFLDGNGRLGRLLITLLLLNDGVISEPLLYLSLYFKSQRTRYYDLLQKVRIEGAWEEWIAFFLDAVESTSKQAVETSRRILQLFEQDRAKIKTGELGRSKGSALQIFDLLQKKPLITIANAAAQSSLSQPAVTKAMKHLQELEIVKELSGRSWKRLYAYQRYLDILNQGMEPLPNH